MATDLHSGCGSKKRRTNEEGEQAAEEDRISALPEALQLHILGLLPFKSAIRTGALSTQWRELWTRRWPAPASLNLRLGPHDSPQPLLESLERRGRRRLDQLSFSFQIGQITPEDLDLFLDYAAACAVADLHVHLSNPEDMDRCFDYTALPGNRHLARLSLDGICVRLTNCYWYQSQLHYALPRPYSVLEVIRLHRVTIEDATFYVAACPRLRTLDVCYCEDLRRANLSKPKANLNSITVVECESLADVWLSNSSSFRSFRYSGAYLAAADVIRKKSAIGDLYICFGGPACRRLRSRRFKYDDYGRPCKLRGCWLDKLIKLSNLTVLTLCSSALRRVSAKARARSTAGNGASCRLQNLREVQLLMFAMYNENFDDIMTFLITCCTPRLERLFVQLPTRSNQYKPDEEPSDSEEDGSEEELSEGEESEEDQSESESDWSEADAAQELSKGEEPEEDQSEQYESEEEGAEEDHPKDCKSEEHGLADSETEQDESEEEESEEEHSQDDESEEVYSQDDESEEDHSQDDESEEDYSQEDKLEEEGSEEDESEENGLAEGQSKDGSKRELSDGGQSAEEPLGDGCENLMFLKMTNFMGHHNEMRLVSFVLKKSGRLNQLILFTPESDHPEGPQKDHLNTSDFLQTKLLPLEKASPNAQIILSEPDAAAAIKPLHSETFVKV